MPGHAAIVRKPFFRTTAGGYGLAVFAVAVAAVARWALDPLLGATGEYLTFYFSVIVIATAAGSSPGLLTIVLGSVVGKALFIYLGHTDYLSLDSTIRLVLFMSYGGTAVVLVARLRRSEERLGRLQESARFLEERARWKHVVEGIADEVWVCDAEGRMGLVNLPAATQMGLEEFRDKTVDEVLQTVEILNPDGGVRPASEAPLLRALNGETVRGEEIMRHRPTGNTRWRQFSAAPVRDVAGAIVGSVAVVRDITDYRRMDAELRDAHARLAESDRRKDQFLAVLSHELRNPLAPIRYALPLLEEEAAGFGDSARRAVTIIRRQSDHLIRLVDELLDVSRIARGKVELRREPVAVKTIAAAAVEAALPMIQANRHTLTVRVPEDPIPLHADPVRMAQVVTNLLNNSAKFTPRGGEIALEASRDGSEAVIRVRDSGIGIPADELGRVFEMFRQASQPDKPQGGLGIGLALARQLVEMHGGSIQARSDGPGRGAEFVVRLPLAAAGAAAEPATSQVYAPGDLQKLKVLIVDDNADLVEMLALTVASLGHDVRKALDGQTAVSAAKAYCPDVVLLDLGLPVMSGIEVAREIRRFPATAQARLVALTGGGQADDLRRTTEAGFDAHLTKPTEPDVLRRLLGELASRSAERHRRAADDAAIAQRRSAAS